MKTTIMALLITMGGRLISPAYAGGCDSLLKMQPFRKLAAIADEEHEKVVRTRLRLAAEQFVQPTLEQHRANLIDAFSTVWTEVGRHAILQAIASQLISSENKSLNRAAKLARSDSRKDYEAFRDEFLKRLKSRVQAFRNSGLDGHDLKVLDALTSWIISSQTPLEFPAYSGCFVHNCFVAGSLVSTPRGNRPIEELRAGDEVYSYDFNLGRRIVNRIGVVHVAIEDFHWLRTEHLEQPIGVNEFHPFFCHGQTAPKPIGEVLRDERLLRVRDATAPPEPIRILALDPGDEDMVFNLHLEEEPHNFLIFDLVVSNVCKT